MKKRPILRRLSVLLVTSILILAVGTGVLAAQLSGAIFTTTVDGNIVNENVHYEAKEDVYLDGGPGPNAPPTAAGLPEGDYYFQVTDPSGKDLLSTDHISCRKIHINEFGVIDFVYSGINYVWQNGQNSGWIAETCQHNQGVDIDHFELGAITVQLFPYDDTPNPGGVYKAWITRVEDYAGDPNFVPLDKKDAVNGENYQPGNYHGFIPAKSKTDNYKVKKKGKPYEQPLLTVQKFHDSNFNGVWDMGEEEITGWAVDITDPSGVINTYYTPQTILVDEGTYIAVEEQPAGSVQTAGIIDGASVGPGAVEVAVAGISGETHEIIFGNAGLGQITACKIYDRNGNGVADLGEPGVEGWKMSVNGTDVLGVPIYLVAFTGADGCAIFDGLLPGTYTVAEIMPGSGTWQATGPTSSTVTIESTVVGASVIGTFADAVFTNACSGEADFDTKGYWHNKNGLLELTWANIEYVNGLSPYSSPSSYFGAGDEPFDGFFEDGSPVAASKGVLENEDIAPAGSWESEISQFLVDANAGGDPREQLAQQLLAFIFNTMHRLDAPAATIELPDGSLVSAADLIGDAIAIWESGTSAEQTEIASLLDWLNNNDAVSFIPFNPCPVIYP